MAAGDEEGEVGVVDIVDFIHGPDDVASDGSHEGSGMGVEQGEGAEISFAVEKVM